MGLFEFALKVGVVAGAAYAVKKIVDKAAAENPEGFADKEAKKTAYKKAAKDLYDETAATVKEKAPVVKEKVAEKAKVVTGYVGEKAPGVTEFVSDKAKAVSDYVSEKTPVVKEFVGDKAKVVADFATGTYNKVAEKAPELVDKVTTEVKNFAEAAEAKFNGFTGAKADAEAEAEAPAEETEEAPAEEAPAEE